MQYADSQVLPLYCAFISHINVTTGWRTGVRFPAAIRKGHFSLRNCVQTSPGAHPDSYPVGTGASFAGSKAAVEW